MLCVTQYVQESFICQLLGVMKHVACIILFTFNIEIEIETAEAYNISLNLTV